MDLSSAPPWETHVSLGVGIIALVLAIMTLPTVFQMFFGKPKIALDFKNDVPGNGTTRLLCLIRNEGISSGFLRRMGVVRSPVEISASFRISEWRGREIVHLVRPTLVTDRGKGLHVDLPFAISPARFVLVIHMRNVGAIILQNPDPDEEKLALSPGTYVADIMVVTAHQEIKTASQRFTVGLKPADTFWIGRADA